MDDFRMRDGCRRALHFQRMVRVLCPATLFHSHFLHNGTRFAPHFQLTVRIFMRRASVHLGAASRIDFRTTVHVLRRIYA